jgi:hypothetical protein
MGRVPSLMLYDCNPNPLFSNLAEIDYIRESWHKRPSNTCLQDHPSLWCGGDSNHQPLELINESKSKTRAPVFVIIAIFLKLLLDSRVVLDNHWRSRAIISS